MMSVVASSPSCFSRVRSIGIADPEHAQPRRFLRQDVIDVDVGHVLKAGRVRAAGTVGRIERHAVLQALGRLELDGIAVVRGQRELVRRIGFGRGGRQRNAGRLQLLGKAQRQRGLFIEQQATPLVVLEERGSRLADGRGDHAGLLGRFEQGVDQEQVAFEEAGQVVEDGIILGEYRLLEIHLDVGGIGALRAGLPHRVAVIAGRAGEAAGGEACGIHHGEGRIGRVIVGELDTGFAKRMEVGRIGGIDRIRTQPVPDEEDDVAVLGRGIAGALDDSDQQGQGDHAPRQSDRVSNQCSARPRHGPLPIPLLYGGPL